MVMQTVILSALAIAAALLPSLGAVEYPEELVNLLGNGKLNAITFEYFYKTHYYHLYPAGTFTEGQQFSTGNTLPLIGRPWGFNHWAPQTREEGRAGSWYYSDNYRVYHDVYF